SLCRFQPLLIAGAGSSTFTLRRNDFNLECRPIISAVWSRPVGVGLVLGYRTEFLVVKVNPPLAIFHQPTKLVVCQSEDDSNVLEILIGTTFIQCIEPDRETMPGGHNQVLADQKSGARPIDFSDSGVEARYV